MQDFQYGFKTELEGIDFDQALERTIAELKKEGFGVLTDIDVKDTFKKKLEVDFRRYRILGACNPKLAKQAIDREDQIGLLLPCNVVVQESEEGRVVVSIADPLAMFRLVDNADITPVAREAGERLRRALAAVGGS